MADLQILPAEQDSRTHLHFPNEVLLLIFGYSRKEELKKIRRASKTCNGLATPLLFDNIYISPHQKDLEVFTNISQSPHLSRSIRRLIYDTSTFTVGSGKEWYVKQVLQQTSYLLWNFGRGHEFKNADEQINDLLRAAHPLKPPEYEMRHTERKLLSYRIINRGYEAYLTKAKEQRENEKGELVARLCMGLERLPNLQTVSFEYEWASQVRNPKFSVETTLTPLFLEGSPLSRSFHPLYLRPTSAEPPKYLSPLFIAFPTVMRALALTRKEITRLEYAHPHGIADYVFDSKATMNTALLQHTIDALRHVRHLNIGLHAMDTSDFKSAHSTMPEILRSMANLEGLEINVNESDRDDLIPYSLSEIFGRTPFTWSNLSTLYIQYFACSQTELLSFLRLQYNLSDLHLEGIELGDGKWADTFDDLRHLPSLKSFAVTYPLRDDGGVDLWDGDERGCEIETALEKYVLKGSEENPLRKKSVSENETDSDG
ncbi:MAG: hypothetical protein Q9187_001751, partial [Circinaria calcarea]